MADESLSRPLTWTEIVITSLLAVMLGISVGTSTLQQIVISFLTN